MFILIILEKRPADVLKAFRKDVLRVTSLGRPQRISFEPLVEMYCHCIIFNFTSPNMCLKYEQVSCFIVLGFWRHVSKTPYKDPKVTSEGWRSQDVPRAYIFNISTKRISVVKFSVLVYQMCVLDTKKLVTAYSFSLGETS